VKNNMMICLTVLMLLFTQLVHADEKDRVAYLTTRTVVYVYNPAHSHEFGHLLRSTFNLTSNGKPLDEGRYYPNKGDKIAIEGPTAKDKSGITMVAEFGRNIGIKKGTTYTFTETIDLPGVGPVLQLKQLVTGNTIGSDAVFGIAAPDVGIPEQWIDENDTNWYSVVIPHTDLADNTLGFYQVSFRSYYKSLASDKMGDTTKGTIIATGIGAGAGLVVGSALAAGKVAYDAETIKEEIKAARRAHMLKKDFDEGIRQSSLKHDVRILQSQKRESRSARNSAAFELAKEGGGTALIVSGVTVGLAALSGLVSSIPSIYPNVIYKIEYIKADPTLTLRY